MERKPAPHVITHIEQLNVIVGVLLILGACIVWHDPEIPLSVAVGSFIGGANFWVLSWIITRMMSEAPHKLRLAVFALLKFAALIFVLWAVIKWLPINAIAFLVGLSTVVVAISGVSLRGAVATKQSPELK